MKKLIFCLAVLVFFVSCGPAVSSNNLSEIAGYIVDVDDGEPLNAANVNLIPGGHHFLTGSDGYFAFLDVEPGQYEVSAQKDGYSTDRQIVNVRAGEINDKVKLQLRKKE